MVRVHLPQPKQGERYGKQSTKIKSTCCKNNEKDKKFERKGWKTGGLKKELSYCMGETPRPAFKTGATVDPRKNKGLRFRESSNKKDDKENNK